jgi:hypothetical protein
VYPISINQKKNNFILWQKKRSRAQNFGPRNFWPDSKSYRNFDPAQKVTGLSTRPEKQPAFRPGLKSNRTFDPAKIPVTFWAVPKVLHTLRPDPEMPWAEIHVTQKIRSLHQQQYPMDKQIVYNTLMLR